MYRMLAAGSAAGLALALATTASAATTVVLNFDDLAGIGPVPSTYQGVHFGDDFTYYNSPDEEYPNHSGTAAIYNNYEKTKPGDNGYSIFRFDDAVRFDGAWFSGHLGVVYELYRDGQRLSVASTSLDNTSRFFASGYDGLVDEVRIFANSGNWVMDDLTYTTGITAVPEPAAWALMILGLGGAGAALRSQRRRAFA